MKQRMFSSLSEARPGRRPRVLIESADPARHAADLRRLREAGIDVALCSGPVPGDLCPALLGGSCDLVDEADLVVIGPEMASREELAAAHHRHRPDLPVVVQAESPATVPESTIDRLVHLLGW